ncbi:uncharacterized protein VTP21DRAFT_11352 [Calcarisporiella thermophila]|uniref:uncharacterized protein n=1 Tax=Calcarisporiella thermophila TaxID=911321 RepID=UPI0037438A83
MLKCFHSGQRLGCGVSAKLPIRKIFDLLSYRFRSIGYVAKCLDVLETCDVVDKSMRLSPQWSSQVLECHYARNAFHVGWNIPGEVYRPDDKDEVRSEEVGVVRICQNTW